ncbi:pyridoxal phosphate phosphatase PHOSPHO2-like [Clavelina lepadiformis]|uniref:pyridoxal phosphate phosphatase PHOSPHO2-like n=1 Tax=Clavelina lepadiformis TaxID=159417 RepID=UPI004043757C
MNKKTSKRLVVFDFDHTFVQDNTDMVVFDMIQSSEAKQALWNQYEKGKWTNFMNEVFDYLYNNKFTLNEMKMKLKNMKIVDGMLELFEFLKANSHIFDCIIVSDSNQWFIESILEVQGLRSIIKHICTNKATIQNGKLHVLNCHSHSHSACPVNMCKGQLLMEYKDEMLKSGTNYISVCYIGDGSNDYCPCERLHSNDYVFARKDYPLEKKIISSSTLSTKNILAKCAFWVSGVDILHKIKHLI